MPRYDSAGFHPPAPVARVTLRNPRTMANVPDVPMLLDTGADVTLLPQAAVLQLGIDTAAETYYELEGFDGTVSLAPVVQLDFIFEGRTFRGRFLVLDQKMGIIGRNILNALPILFDGPGLLWQLGRSH